MIINANYTWLKCRKCGHITKVLPGQKFNSAQELTDLYKCECVVEQKPKKRVSNAT